MPSYFFHLVFELYAPDSPHLKTLPLTNTLASEISITSNKNVFVPQSVDQLWRGLPNTRIETTSRRYSVARVKSAKSPAKEHLDARFGRCTIESIDMAPVSRTTNNQRATNPKQGPSPPATALGASSKLASGPVVPRARFIPLESKTTNAGYGIIHLYRDNVETPGLHTGNERRRERKGSVNEAADEEIEDSFDDEEAFKTVAILAVPSYMTASDFLGFVGDKTCEAVSHFRMIRTAKANRYMVLMKFREKEEAKRFVECFNGTVFNSMEPENCHIVYIKSIRFTNGQPLPSEGGSTALEGPERRPSGSVGATAGLPQPSSSAVQLSSKPAPPPTPALTELPTCPVCLERMDESTGLLTIICQHVFHCACLSKWKDSSCPVCRYTHHSGKHRARHVAVDEEDGEDEEDDSEDEVVEEQFCYTCNADSNLWICLICGNIGCGRYDEAHAFSHYQETSHSYAMDLDTQRVWDYAGDNYVHRLLQNKSDGKVVELPPRGLTGLSPDDAEDYVPREKLEKITMEYTYLLSSQLDSQRAYFEEIVAKAADKSASANAQLEATSSKLDKALLDLSGLQTSYETLLSDFQALEKSKGKLEARAKKLEELARRWEKEAREEKSMNEGLVERVGSLAKEVEESKKERQELKEQVRDLMVYLDAMNKIGEEGVGGSVSVGEAKQGKSRRRK